MTTRVLVFSVNFERHVCTHITTSIKCYLNSLTYEYVPFTKQQKLDFFLKHFISLENLQTPFSQFYKLTKKNGTWADVHSFFVFFKNTSIIMIVLTSAGEITKHN